MGSRKGGQKKKSPSPNSSSPKRKQARVASPVPPSTNDKPTGDSPSAPTPKLPGPRSKPKWGLKLVFEEQNHNHNCLSLKNCFKTKLPNISLTIRQIHADIFILSPSTPVDSNLLIDALKFKPIDGLFGGFSYRVEVPEEVRKPIPKIFSVIARNIDEWTTDQDIKDELVAHGYTGIELVSRFKKENRTMPLCRIDFSNSDSAKRLLSEGLKVGYCLFKCEEPKQRPIPVQCFKCQGFGHMAGSCANDALCRICGQKAHTLKGERCNNPKRCANCNLEHTAAYKGCGDYAKAVKLLENPQPKSKPVPPKAGQTQGNCWQRPPAMVTEQSKTIGQRTKPEAVSGPPAGYIAINAVGDLLQAVLSNLLKGVFNVNAESQISSQPMFMQQVVNSIQQSIATFIQAGVHTTTPTPDIEMTSTNTQSQPSNSII